MAVSVLLFDLDDTLYPEISYVYSGFAAVAEMIGQGPESQDSLTQRMKDLFRVERKGVFDRLIEDEVARRFMRRSFQHPDSSTDSSKIVRTMVTCYKQHVPTIRLYPDAKEVLSQCLELGMRVGIVTDGERDVQEKKIAALGLGDFVEHVICTDALGAGRRHWKPSPYAFEVALRLFGANAHEASYVGDNPTKDFVGPALLGIRTVQVVRSDGLYAESQPVQRPEFVVSSLRELFSLPIFHDLRSR